MAGKPDVVAAGLPDNPGESAGVAADGKDSGSLNTLWRGQRSTISRGALVSGVPGTPGAPPRWRRDADVVVVGSGAAGIAVALTAAERGLRVLVVTKDLVGGATPLAQGGLAAALGAGDTRAAHASDTLIAGAGLCEPDVVAALADGAPGAVGWLAGLGAQLETRDLRLEGGHSARRIVHSGDDATGAEVHRTLLAALLGGGIEILDRTVALDLLLSHTGEAEASRRVTGPSGPATRATGSAGTNRAARATGPGATTRAARATEPGEKDGAGTGTGARAMRGAAAANAGPAGPLGREPVPARPVTGLAAALIGADGRLTPGVISARAVVIAAGGLGQAFGTTSNPAGATGDGIAAAARAGAVIRDLEFVQFHPTVLWLPGASGQCPLITEALRGAGAVLRDLDGTPLMAGHDPRGDLAPRDVVAARMAEVIGRGFAEAGHVWLDATGLGRDLLENGFPTVTAACRKHGIDPVTQMIPVAPGAHYSCGGILASLDGRTSLPGLFAAGEAASTGVQGANRLASNSVTEAIIAGRRAGAAIAASLPAARPAAPSRQSPPPGPAASPGAMKGTGARARRLALAQAMSRYAGVMRDADGLARLLEEIAGAGDDAGSTAPDANLVAPAVMAALDGDGQPGGLDLEAVEAANLRVVSALIAAGARRRAESRGCHRRRDAAGAAAAPWHTLARWDGRRLVVTKEAL
jgi:L-aspartate oxidase